MLSITAGWHQNQGLIFINLTTTLSVIWRCFQYRSLKLSNINTANIENLTVEMTSEYKYNTRPRDYEFGRRFDTHFPQITSEITAAAEEIDIVTAITKFSDMLVDKLNDSHP